MERVILHADANSFYASVECLSRPDLWGQAVAVCGDPQLRHGIVLTKNPLAKAAGVKTGEPVWQAMRKCPSLVVLSPHHEKYADYSRRLRAIFEDYTQHVEPYGLDEAWLDVSGPRVTLGEGERIADEIRLRVRAELGITVSIGVSFGKVLAKLGSDMKKPDATTVIDERALHEVVWKLPAAELLFVGGKTMSRLKRLNILTIGDLALADGALLTEVLGKQGALLQGFAQGKEASPVACACAEQEIKSVSNSTTPPRDIETPEELKSILYMLAESVARRLRADNLAAGCVSVALRSTALTWRSHQTTVRPLTNVTGEIASAALRVAQACGQDILPLRGAGLACSKLMPDGARQLDFFGLSERHERERQLDRAVDGLREKFGHQVVRRGVELIDADYARIRPREDQGEVTPFHAG